MVMYNTMYDAPVFAMAMFCKLKLHPVFRRRQEQKKLCFSTKRFEFY